MIPLTDCIKGHIYKLDSRNLAVGIFDGETGFIGIRYKFGDSFLFTEYHWDTGPPYGTAKPREDICVLPEKIKPVETLCTYCDICKREVTYIREGLKWVYKDTGEEMEEKGIPRSNSNKDLFNFLFPINKQIIKEKNKNYDKFSEGDGD
jgi:hypothetical protein